MLYKNLVIALVVGVIGIYSQASYASEEISSFCDTCVTDQQYMTHARSLIEKDGSITAHIFNMSEFGYKKYNTSRISHIECEYDKEPDGRGGNLQICRKQHKYTTTELVISNQDLIEFTNYAIAYNDAANTFSLRSVEVPALLTDTAFNLIENSFVQGKVIYYFNNNTSLKDVYAEKFENFLGSSSKIINNTISVNAPPLVFAFSDGTLAFAVLDFVDSDGQYHFKFIKIQDKHNSIDLRKSNPFTGSYTFIGMSQSSWGAFFNALKNLGLTVRGAKESIIPRGVVRIVPMCDGKEGCVHPN